MTSVPTIAPPIADWHQSAASLCLAGHYAQALSTVKPMLEPHPALTGTALAEALNLAAVCSLGLGQPADAQAYWRQAIEAKPDFIDAYNNLGMLLKGLGSLVEAEVIYRQLLGIRPDLAEASNNLGAVLYDLGRLRDAETAYRQALAIRADYAQAHYNLGIVLYDMRRWHEAERAYRQALVLSPDAGAFNNLGNVLKELARLPEAEAAYRQALVLRPQYADALNNLANVLKELGRLPEAELACRMALTIRPDFAEAHLNLGALMVAFKRLPEAEVSYRQALAVRPDYAEAHYNLGIVLQALDRLPEAEAAYGQALLIRPDIVEAHNNLGNVLWALHRPADAVAAYRRALALRPDLAEGHHNLGNVLEELGHLTDAEAAFRRALAIRADYHDAKVSLSTLLLSMGEFEEGWRLYDSRYEQLGFIHHQTQSWLKCPRWRGEALAGKSLLLWQEDGLGDMVQFGRYLPQLKAQGASHVAFACAPALHRLFAAVEGVDAVLDHEAAQGRAHEYDYWASPMSAPLHLRTTPDTIPDPIRLTPDPLLVEHWRTRLATLPPGRKVGLVWKGNPKHHNDANRSLPSLATFAPLWSVSGVSFVSLQKGQGEEEGQSPPAGLPLLHLGTDLRDFADTAAIIGELDLLICVDTAAAHIAASLGKPCWVLLPREDIDWRWMRERDDSPWYPQTLRLFRQAADESWSTAVERVRLACIAAFSSRAPSPQG
ncbi:Tetratricopeptide repeat protein (plasmid) [Caballeronia sp. SBC1]|uniref:tetratricopeptide repeat protein n=1 Tax=unclassified Caballeronia TaxID=2646786 RepID=UPI0013E18994|nr:MULTISPECIES: tetratricopeptide repeat protein [unclassified Caballeronia]QIE28893.1 Tetratricopeptide repeat protein [Caballeronia sp. SBC2]QIN66948.1 Tetratricopeptide repeat protein [Caballeronia sp. SBC1]